jgi:hypothetical protein
MFGEKQQANMVGNAQGLTAQQMMWAQMLRQQQQAQQHAEGMVGKDYFQGLTAPKSNVQGSSQDYAPTGFVSPPTTTSKWTHPWLQQLPLPLPLPLQPLSGLCVPKPQRSMLPPLRNHSRSSIMSEEKPQMQDPSAPKSNVQTFLNSVLQLLQGFFLLQLPN